eukprot:1229801-Prorocentrum_lima.AAC.1
MSLVSTITCAILARSSIAFSHSAPFSHALMAVVVVCNPIEAERLLPQAHLAGASKEEPSDPKGL